MDARSLPLRIEDFLCTFLQGHSFALWILRYQMTGFGEFIWEVRLSQNQEFSIQAMGFACALLFQKGSRFWILPIFKTRTRSSPTKTPLISRSRLKVVEGLTSFHLQTEIASDEKATRKREPRAALRTEKHDVE